MIECVTVSLCLSIYSVDCLSVCGLLCIYYTACGLCTAGIRHIYTVTEGLRRRRQQSTLLHVVVVIQMCTVTVLTKVLL